MQAASLAAGPASLDLQALLRRDHARLEAMYEDVVAAFRAGDCDEAGALWNAFAGGLEAHMALEEKRILPEFAKLDASEAAALRREHAEIRTSLDELGIGVDLHCTTPGAVERFIRTLKAHAEREDALMYRWASEGAPISVRAKWLSAARKLIRSRHEPTERRTP